VPIFSAPEASSSPRTPGLLLGPALYLAKIKSPPILPAGLDLYKCAVLNFYRPPPTRSPRNGGDDGDVRRKP
jgi:hypothetical protein